MGNTKKRRIAIRIAALLIVFALLNSVGADIVAGDGYKGGNEPYRPNHVLYVPEMDFDADAEDDAKIDLEEYLAPYLGIGSEACSEDDSYDLYNEDLHNAISHEANRHILHPIWNFGALSRSPGSFGQNLNLGRHPSYGIHSPADINQGLRPGLTLGLALLNRGDILAWINDGLDGTSGVEGEFLPGFDEDNKGAALGLGNRDEDGGNGGGAEGAGSSNGAENAHGAGGANADNADENNKSDESGDYEERGEDGEGFEGDVNGENNGESSEGEDDDLDSTAGLNAPPPHQPGFSGSQNLEQFAPPRSSALNPQTSDMFTLDSLFASAIGLIISTGLLFYAYIAARQREESQYEQID